MNKESDMMSLKRNIIFTIIFTVLSFSVFAGINTDLENGMKLFNAEKYSEANKVFTDITNKESDNPIAWYYLGRLCFMDYDFEMVIDHLKKAIKLDQNNSEYYYWLGKAYRKNIEKVSKFKIPFIVIKWKSAFEKAVELDPNNIQARFELMMYYLNVPAVAGGSKEKAHEQAAEIKKRDPQMGHEAYVNIYKVEKKYEMAEKEYIALIETDPKNFNYHIDQAWFYINTKDYDKAYEKLVKMIEVYPEKALPYYLIGQIGFKSNNYLEEAEKNMLICINIISSSEPETDIEKHLNSQTHTLHYILGTMYEKNGKKDLAKKEYENALKIKNDYKEVKEALGKLQ